MTRVKKIFIYIVIGIIIILILMFFYFYKSQIIKIIMPFIIAVGIAYVLNPLVLKLNKRRLSKGVSIILLYLIFAILITTIVIFVIPELANNTKDLMKTLPEITKSYQDMFDKLMNSIRTSNWPVDVKEAIYGEIQNGILIAQNFVMETLKKSISTLVGTITMFFYFITGMFIAYYFIKDADLFRNGFLSLSPRKWRNQIVGTGREINSVLTNFIQGQLLVALIVGIMEMAGLLIINVKYALILGIIGGIANIIPYFGPFIGAIPAVAIAIIDSPAKAIWTIAVFTIIQQIDNSFISPKIIEGKLGLHPVTTILVVIIGGEFYGILGMLISVPITAIIKVIIKRFIASVV